MLQLEIYKADFEAERKAKESIKEEKEKLTEDLQNLQRRNQQLQERIDMISDRDFVMYESRETRNRERRSNGQVSEIILILILVYFDCEFFYIGSREYF